MHNAPRTFRVSLFARMLALAATTTVLCWLSLLGSAAAVAAPTEQDPPPEAAPSDDVTGDNIADTITAEPDGDGTTSAGIVEITSGADGSAVSTIEGKEDGDKFGQSLAIIGPDPNGIRHLLIGAPEDSGTGRAYFFQGPFTASATPEVQAEQALFQVQSAFGLTAAGNPDDYAFGVKTAPLFDINADGFMEFRVGSLWNDGIALRSVVHVYDGATATLLFMFVSSDDFDPWASMPGDINGDSIVDQIDLDIVTKNIGASGPNISILDGDLNADGFVDALDVLEVFDAFNTRSLYIGLDEDDQYTVFDAAGRPVSSFIPLAGPSPCGWICCKVCTPATEHCRCGGDPGPSPCPSYPCNCPCNPECENFDPCSLLCNPPPDCGNPCRQNPCGANCPNRPPWCDDPCFEDPCSPDCPDAACDPQCGGSPCAQACWYAPCNEACGGDPCNPACPEPPPCDALQECGGGDAEQIVCVGEVKTFTARECPEACEQGCQPGDEWEWEIDDESRAIFVGGSTGDTVVVLFIGPGSITITATNGCCSIQFVARVLNIDLRLDVNSDGTIDATDDSRKTVAPGKLIQVNDDDDNQNDTPDFQESGAVENEDDLVEIAVILDEDFANGKWRIEYSWGKIGVWTSLERGDEHFVSPSEEYDAPAPAILYVEADRLSDFLGDVSLTFESEIGETQSWCASPTILFTVVPTQFEIQVTAWIPEDHFEHPVLFDRVFHADAPGGVVAFDLTRNSFRMRQSVTVIPTLALDKSPNQNGEVAGTNSSMWPPNQRLVGWTRLYQTSTSVGAPPAPFLTQAARDDNILGEPMMVDKAQANPSHNTISVSRFDPATVIVTMKMSTGDPLVAGAPHIDWELIITLFTWDPLRPEYTITGDRDGYPAHDIYINTVLVDSHDPTVTGEGIISLYPPMEHHIATWNTLP